MMGNPYVNIYFDYGGHYTKSEDSVEWHQEGETYGISYQTTPLGEITYSDLVARICKKVGADLSKTSLRLSFTPLVVLPRIKTNVRDDDDVYLYLTTTDSQQRRSALHVEVVTELEMDNVPATRSSHGGNYMEMLDLGVRDNVQGSPGVVSIHGGNEAATKNCDSGDSLENEIIGVGDDESREEQNIDLDNGVDNVVDHQLELGETVEESASVEAWEDGMNLQVGQEFESKQAVKDVVERALHEKCFGTSLINSDKYRYVMKCDAAKKGCKWGLRVTRVKNSTAFTVRTYNKMHTCFRTSSSTSNKKRGTPRLVANIIKEDYSGQFEIPRPKSLIELVQKRVGVKVSYSTALRGKKQADNDMRDTPEEG